MSGRLSCSQLCTVIWVLQCAVEKCVRPGLRNSFLRVVEVVIVTLSNWIGTHPHLLPSFLGCLRFLFFSVSSRDIGRLQRFIGPCPLSLSQSKVLSDVLGAHHVGLSFPGPWLAPSSPALRVRICWCVFVLGCLTDSLSEVLVRILACPPVSSTAVQISA